MFLYLIQYYMTFNLYFDLVNGSMVNPFQVMCEQIIYLVFASFSLVVREHDTRNDISFL